MTEYELQLINLIREKQNTERALATAIEIILAFAKQTKPPAPESSVVSQESDVKTNILAN